MFLQVAERLDDYDPRYRFFSWIYRIAVNESLNLLRRNGREEPLDEDDRARRARRAPTRNGRPTRPSVAERIQQRVDGHDDERPDGADAAALLRLQLPRRSRDILDIDEKTVKSRLFEARAAGCAGCSQDLRTGLT